MKPTSIALVVAAIADQVNADPDILFPYEKKQLTKSVIANLKDGTIAKLVDFAPEPIPSEYDGPSCKVFPGGKNWPPNWVWDAFNALLEGQLIANKPIGAPCYTSQWGPRDAAQCSAIVSTFTQPDTHENDPTSAMFPIFQGRTCMARTNTSSTDTCTIGGFPTYSVNISSVLHVQAAVNFARSTNVRLVVKNTGHCYLGKSLGAGALSIWTHNLQDIEFLPEYTAVNYTGPAFKFGAGITVEQAYRAAEAAGVSVQGGICPSVGYVGGYIQGGGHNPLSGYYGMAADSVLSLQVVLPSGEFVTASADSHPDLFWALRGGGGGTFGVVTSAIVKAHPKMQAVHASYILGNLTDGSQIVSRANFWAGVRKYWESFPKFTDAGTYSWFFIRDKPGTGLELEMQSFFAPGHSLESFRNLTKDMFDEIDRLGIPYRQALNATQYSSYLPAYWDAWGSRPQRLGVATSLPGNYLLPRANFEKSGDGGKLFNETFNTLVRHVEKGWVLGGYHQAPQNRQGVDNAVSSVWRSTQAFLITGSPAFEETAAEEQVASARKVLLGENLAAWKSVAPPTGREGAGGSYLNEAAVDDPDWKTAFYGSQYGRLVEIKKKYDPYGLMYVTTGVASDEWELVGRDRGATTQNGRLCRRAGATSNSTN